MIAVLEGGPLMSTRGASFFCKAFGSARPGTPRETRATRRTSSMFGLWFEQPKRSVVMTEAHGAAHFGFWDHDGAVRASSLAGRA